MTLSVVIVSYNTKDKLKMTLESVFASQAKYSFDVWVVDNASQDGSADMVEAFFPRVKLLRNSSNLGFSKANNIAIAKSTGRYVLLLNSDVDVMPDTFDIMLKFMDNNKDVGIAGCKVVKPDGSLDKAARRSFPTPFSAFCRFTGLAGLFPNSQLFARYNLTYLPEDETYEVDSVMGAFLLIRRETVSEVGLLDEDFFMYGEDIDWCWRVKEAGYKVMYAPLTRVIHHKGSSSRKASEKALYEFHRAMVLFYDKHYRDQYGRLLTFCVKVGIWKVYFLRRFINVFRKEKTVSK